MKILLASSESRPFSKTGGLGDVVYSLGKELAIMGEEVFVVTPLYASIREKTGMVFKKVLSFNIDMSWRKNTATIYVSYASGMTFYFVDNSFYFGRDGFYGYQDDAERFAFFNLAIKELCYRINLKPDIIHANDWHTGMLPVLFKEDDYARNYFNNTRFVFTIHNPAFQGFFSKDGLGDFYNLPISLFENGTLRYDNRVSSLKAGIIYSDKITTVSPNHRNELLSVEGGMGLNEILEYREYDFVGILNGIDYLEFNPNDDDLIPEKYNMANAFVKKEENRNKVLESFGLANSGQPTFGIVSRLSWQKGFEITYKGLEALLNKGCNVLLLGSGEVRLEQMFEHLNQQHKERMVSVIGYNDEFAHKIFASSDFILVPSLFEPCGLTQMIAQRYGSVPIVRETGGLKDSVIPFNNENEKTANGYSFVNFNEDSFYEVCMKAYEDYFDTKLRKNLIKNAMKVDNSWNKSATKYLDLYKSIN